MLRTFSGFGAISRLPMGIFRILAISRWAKGVFTIEALYYWPLIGNHTMGIQRYHFDLLRWPILGVLSPHCLNFVHISKIAFIIIILIIFCIFLSYYCYRLGCIIHKLVEFNAYSVVLRVSCRPIVYYCILLSLRSVKDETKALITIYLTFFNLPCPATATTATA